MNLNVVLAEPQIPQNTGNVARTCAATGARLHIIDPLFELDDAKMKRAGLDYWDKLNVSVYADYNEFFTTAEAAVLQAEITPEYWFYETRTKHIYSDVVYSDNCYLIFGREDKGLPQKLLDANEERCVQIPMRKGLRSLNLANGVAVGVYEVLRQWGFPELV